MQEAQSKRKQVHIGLQVFEVNVRVPDDASQLRVDFVLDPVDQGLLRVPRLQNNDLQDVLQVVLQGALVHQRVVQRVPVQGQLGFEDPLSRFEETRLETQNDSGADEGKQRVFFLGLGLRSGLPRFVGNQAVVVVVDQLVLDVGPDVDVFVEDQAEQVGVCS